MSRLHDHHSLRVTNPNRRLKLSHDPNNVAWSRSATKYGQKILQLHGWTPGSLLGASGAAYSDLHSTASASHIKIALKDDNLRLGARQGAAHNNSEPTGLDEFQDLLRRLNGTDPSNLQNDRIQRSNLRNSAYINQRWGNPRFVSGGFLVGEGSRDVVKDDHDELENFQQSPSHHSDNAMLPEANRPQELQSENLRRRRQKKPRTFGDDDSAEKTSKRIDWTLTGAQSATKLSVKSDGQSQTSPRDMYNQIEMSKVRRQAERAERKQKRQAKRDAKRSLKVRGQSSISPSPDVIRHSGSDIGGVAIASHPLRRSASNRGSQGFGTGRLAVRHRYAQHKKMCMMDQRALNEVH